VTQAVIKKTKRSHGRFLGFQDKCGPFCIADWRTSAIVPVLIFDYLQIVSGKQYPQSQRIFFRNSQQVTRSKRKILDVLPDNQAASID
jgi:hypothetical protein